MKYSFIVHVEDVAQALSIALQSERKWIVFSVVSSADSPVLHDGSTRELGYMPAWDFLGSGLGSAENL